MKLSPGTGSMDNIYILMQNIVWLQKYILLKINEFDRINPIINTYQAILICFNYFLLSTFRLGWELKVIFAFNWTNIDFLILFSSKYTFFR